MNEIRVVIESLFFDKIVYSSYQIFDFIAVERQFEFDFFIRDI